MLLFQLGSQVRQHASRHLIQKRLDIDSQVLRIQQTAVQSFVTNRAEIICNLGEQRLIETGIIRSSSEGLYHNLCCRLRSSKSERRDSRINHVNARFYCFQISHGSHAGCIMAVELNRNLHSLFQRLDQLCCRIRKQKTCHILDTDRVRSHFLNLFCNISPILKRIRVANRVRQRHLRMSFFLIGCLYRCLQVAQIVHTVKNTDNIDAVGNRLLHKILYHIVSIRTVSENILSAEQHLQLCIFHLITDLSQSVPWIFF